MNISSLQSTDYYDYYRTKNNARDQHTAAPGDAEESKSFDAVSTLSDVKPPPPPEKSDFENMSDEDLQSYLIKMQEMTGVVPGTESGTAADDLTGEELANVRSTLIEMSDKAPDLKNAPPRMPNDVSSVPGGTLVSVLGAVKNYTGSIPGVEDSEALEATDLNNEQLTDARSALSAMQQEQFQSFAKGHMEEMLKTGGLPYAVSGLVANA